MKLGRISSNSEFIALRQYSLRENNWEIWQKNGWVCGEWLILVAVIPDLVETDDYFGFAYHRNGMKYTSFKQLPEQIQVLLQKEAATYRMTSR